MRTNRGTLSAGSGEIGAGTNKTGDESGPDNTFVPQNRAEANKTGDVLSPAGSASAQVSAVLAAIAGGAGSWSATGRQAGVSRQRARAIGQRHGVAPERRGARAGRVNVRVRPDSLAALDERAAAWGVSRSEAARHILSAALTDRAADAHQTGTP